jgi:PPOX class probable F420-dependent enzyme
MTLPESAKELVRSGALGHLVTINPDGSPQITCVWVKADGNELVTAHLAPSQRKLANVRRDPRVAISFESSEIRPPGLQDHLVVRGTARIEGVGAPEVLHELAQVYIGPGTKFPPMNDPPPGFLIRITVEKFRGFGPWAE